MRYLFSNFLLLIKVTIVYASNTYCASELAGFKLVKNSVFPFFIENKKACFFAFHTINPDPLSDVRGNGNLGDSIWYGYFYPKKPDKIHEFPKPPDTDWSGVCTLNSVSFYAMYGDKKHNVTVIGSCDRSPINYTIPFVFSWNGTGFVLDEKLYRSLFGLINLTDAEVRKYIKFPRYYKALENRY